jgi:fatty-acyl-CoA synthase
MGRLWLAVPLFWSFGSANAVPAIMTHGGCLVLQERFEAGEALALIERERCSVYYGMGNMARALLEHEDHPGRRLGAMRTGLTIGPPEDIALTIEALGAAELCNVYGSTETYGNCAVTDTDDPLALRLHSQGLPLPGMTIRTVDPVARRPLPEGEIGELAVAGYVTPGYYRAPEEQVLLQHPDIVQAYVVGVPDRSKGELVAAVIELRAGAAADPAAIVAFCRERLASYKVPARLAFRTAAQLPRTPTGKVHKPSLVEQLAANSATWHECKTRTA